MMAESYLNCAVFPLGLRRTVREAEERLSKRDPLGVILYGDVCADSPLMKNAKF